jgi:hypothetical protein
MGRTYSQDTIMYICYYYRRRGWIRVHRSPRIETKPYPFKTREEIMKIMELNMVLYGKW